MPHRNHHRRNYRRQHLWRGRLSRSHLPPHWRQWRRVCPWLLDYHWRRCVRRCCPRAEASAFRCRRTPRLHRRRRPSSWHRRPPCLRLLLPSRQVALSSAPGRPLIHLSRRFPAWGLRERLIPPPCIPGFCQWLERASVRFAEALIWVQPPSCNHACYSPWAGRPLPSSHHLLHLLCMCPA